MSLRAEVRGGLAELHPDWDRLAAQASFVTGRRFLASVDGAATFRVEVTDGERLVAAMPGWIARGTGHAYLEPTRILAELGPGAGPHVVLGAPWGFAAELLADEPPPDAISALEGACLEHAEAVGASGVVALHLDDRSLSLLANPLAVLVGYDAVIDAAPDLGAWLAALPRHRRGRVRAELMAFERAGLRTAIEHDVRCIAELVPIVCASEARHGHPIDPGVLAAAFMDQRERFGDAFRMFTARDRHGRLVAGATAFVDGDALRMRVCGVAGGDAFEYFHVAYYAPLAHAGALGCTRVHLGMESYEAKLLRGARLEPRWAAELGGRVAWDRAAVRRWNARKLAELDALRARFPRAMPAEQRAALCVDRESPPPSRRRADPWRASDTSS